MGKIQEYIKLIITSHSGISSKRVCGVFGFLVISFVLIYCAICGLQAPAIADTFIWAVVVLLGVDSVMNPFYQKYKNGNVQQRENKGN